MLKSQRLGIQLPEEVEKLENDIPFIKSFFHILSFKENREQTWKLHQANKIHSALLIPTNILMAMKKEEAVFIFYSNDIA